MLRRALPAAALLPLLLAPAAVARAHLHLTDPPSRYGASVLKDGPCGRTGGGRSDEVTVFEPGQSIEVVWEEYIDHPSHYRISFDDDGDDDFVDPPTMMDFYSADNVLLDEIEDGRGGIGRATVTLPDMECDNCTLQVIQVMYDKPPYTVGGNDIYYQCADLILTRSGGEDAGTGGDDGGTAGDAGTTGSDGGPSGADAGTTAGGDGGSCSVSPTRSSHGWVAGTMVVAALTLLTRRRSGGRGRRARPRR